MMKPLFKHMGFNMTDDTPVSEFQDCHTGIVAHLNQLAALPALLAPAEQARKNAAEALAFFNKVIYAHHSEEEKDLFPIVERSANSGEERDHVQQVARELTQQHRALEKLWESLEPGLKKVTHGKDNHLNVDDLNALIQRYSDHAHYEETVYLPLAKEILGRQDSSMAALGLSLHMRHAKVNTLYYV